MRYFRAGRAPATSYWGGIVKGKVVLGALWRCIAIAALASGSRASVAGVVLSDEAAKELQLLVSKRGLVPGQSIMVDDMIFGTDLYSIRGFTPGNRWTSGTIPIAFDQSLDLAKRNAFLQACALWNKAGISCVPRTTQANYIKVQQRFGDWCKGSDWISCSWVGMIGGPQELNIAVNHWGSQGVIAHEFGHALGLIYEHMRSDRNRKIQVFMQNAVPKSESDLNPVGGRVLSAYDFKSIMHYQPCAFSRFGDCASNPAHRVIEVKHCRYRDTPLPLNAPTDFDIYSVRKLYELPVTVDPVDYIPPFNPVKIACGPSCATIGGVKYGRVNYNRFSFGIPPIPNPFPSLESICRGFGQAAMPRAKIIRSKTSKGRSVVTIEGNCGCPNTI